jgi:hypothetical protein
MRIFLTRDATLLVEIQTQLKTAVETSISFYRHLNDNPMVPYCFFGGGERTEV